ncbi:MAG: LAGLIDADG family homing endonuclease [Nitrososphaerales archaeon]|nr:LAGLIDADG family homing endonuclease [Nitrososphaerales archaeon]
MSASRENTGLSESESALLDLLRTKGLSIKNLSRQKRRELSDLMARLHNERGLSLTDIASLIGNKTSGYTSWLCRQLGVPVRDFERARLKGIREKRRKYERLPFDGTDTDKAYMLGLRHGDLSVSRPWKGVVRVSTSTTHPAMSALFSNLFAKYGHVYRLPRFKKDTRSYEWNLQVILDESFSFLVSNFKAVKAWVEGDELTVLGYLAGLLDADGSILVTKDARGNVVFFVDYYNSNREILDWVAVQAKRRKLCVSLRINKKKGTRTKRYGIIHRRNYWQLSLFGVDGIMNFVRALQVRHPEKLRRKEIALSTAPGRRYSGVFPSILGLRQALKQEVRGFVSLAETTYLTKHPAIGNKSALALQNPTKVG